MVPTFKSMFAAAHPCVCNGTSVPRAFYLHPQSSSVGPINSEFKRRMFFTKINTFYGRTPIKIIQRRKNIIKYIEVQYMAQTLEGIQRELENHKTALYHSPSGKGCLISTPCARDQPLALANHPVVNHLVAR